MTEGLRSGNLMWERVLMKNFAAVGPKWLLRRRGPAAVEVTLEDGHYMRRHFDHIHAYLGTNSPIVPSCAGKGRGSS